MSKPVHELSKPSEPSPPPPSAEARFAWRSLTASSIAVAVVMVGLLLWYGVWVLLLCFAGILVGVLLRTMAVGLKRFLPVSTGWALAIVVVALVLAAVAVGYFAAGTIVEQVGQLAERLPQSVERVRHHLEGSGVGRGVLRLIRSTSQQDVSMFSRAGQVVTGTFGALVYTLIVIALGIYTAAQPDLYVNGAVDLLPHRARRRARKVLHQVGFTLQWWLIGQLIDMVIIGVLTGVGLWMLGVPLALLLGLLAALFNFVPNFGPLVSYIPAVLLAATDDPSKAIYVTVLYVVLQNVEGYLLMPLIQNKAVDLPPALTIVAQVLLTVLAGAIGLMLSAPLTAAAVVAVKMLYVHDVRGEAVELPEGREGPKPDAPGAKS